MLRISYLITLEGADLLKNWITQGSIVVHHWVWKKKDGREGDNQICPAKALWKRINLLEKRKILKAMQQHNKIRSIH